MENTSQREPLLIAADTNVLLDYAKEDESVIDCFDTIRRRLPASPILVLPTVIHELADLADDGETIGIRQFAETALRRILHPWRFQPVKGSNQTGDSLSLRQAKVRSRKPILSRRIVHAEGG